MALTAAEQYLLELMNRARLDPAAEAVRMGIDLNAGLAAGTISTLAKQVLAPNALLEAAATEHSLWMIQTDIFSHTGANNSQPDQRATAAGYVWSRIGENIAFVGSTGAVSLEGSIDTLNTNLFLSASHRVNVLADGFREIGLGAEVGVFTQTGVNFNVAMLTQDFGTSGTAHFLTGVAYSDTDRDRFYSMGEGTAGVMFRGLGQVASSAAAGGYGLALAADVATAVTGNIGSRAFSLTVDMSPGNVKLDIVGGTTFYTSGSVILGTGIKKVVLLGVGDLNATGNNAINKMTGNAGNNLMYGGAKGDVLTGNGGADLLRGGLGNDKVLGGIGADQLSGNQGNDTLTGGSAADVFIFAKAGGSDLITDFSLAEGDVLRLDHNLWAGQNLNAAAVVANFATISPGEVLFDFGNGQSLHLTGIADMVGFSNQIGIF